jgi:hypothetical protein
MMNTSLLSTITTRRVRFQRSVRFGPWVQGQGRLGEVSAFPRYPCSPRSNPKDRHHLSKGNEVNIPQPGLGDIENFGPGSRGRERSGQEGKRTSRRGQTHTDGPFPFPFLPPTSPLVQILSNGNINELRDAAGGPGESSLFFITSVCLSGFPALRVRGPQGPGQPWNRFARRRGWTAGKAPQPLGCPEHHHQPVKIEGNA